MLTLRTEQTVPALVADTLKRGGASAVLATGQWNATIASFAIEAQFASTLTRAITES